MKTKLSDVARKAGVSVGTASRVLNNHTDVNSDARRRVIEAIDALNYRPLRKRKPSRRPGQARGTRHPNIGVILLGMDDSLVNVPVLGQLLQGIDAEINHQNGNLLFASLPRRDRVPAFLKDNQVDGLIVKTSQYGKLPSPADSPLIRHILRYPIVWAWARPEGTLGDLCSFNPATAGQLAARHLQQKGHRHVGFLNPKKGKSSLEQLKDAFIQACAPIGLRHTLFESTHPQSRSGPEPALESAEDVLPLVKSWKKLRGRSRPTALFVPADNIGVHVYKALESLDLQVGTDVSIIGCNYEKNLVPFLNPPLCTLDVQAEKIGRGCVEQLLWRIRNGSRNSSQSILFEPALVEGPSVQPIHK